MKSNKHSLFNNLFSDRLFFTNLIKIALPIVIQNFIASSLNMVDTIMVGKLGEEEIASVGIANQFFLLFNMAVIGISSGCGIFISQFWGKRDVKNIRKVLGLSLMSCVAASAFFTIIALAFPAKIISVFNEDPLVIELGAKYLRIVCISYVFTAVSFSFSFASRCIEKAMMPMVVSTAALLTNTVLNYVFIFGHFGAPAMGVEGAAFATLIARGIEVLILVVYIYVTRGVLAAKVREMIAITKEFTARVYKTVLPVVLNEGCWGLGFVVYSVAYGRIGTQAITSVQICNTIQNFFLVAIFGIASAASVMIGNKIGAGYEEEGKDYAKRFSILGCMSGAVLGLLLALSTRMVLSLFNVSDTVVHDSVIILYIFSATMVIRVFNILLIVGILRGGGDARYSLIAEAFTMWGIGVPLAFAGAFLFKLPVYLVIVLVTVEEVVKFIIGIARLTSGKWVKNIIHNM